MDDNSKPTIPADESQTPVEPTMLAPVTPPIQPSASNRSGKKLFGKIGAVPAVIIATVMLVGGSAAAYFGLVLPNQPENIWKTALDNTAKGYDELVDYIDNQKDVKGGKVRGSFKYEDQEVVVDGNINGKYDEKTSDVTIDAGASGTRVSLNILTNVPAGSTTPDIYLKADGLTGLGALLGGADPQAAQYLTSLDGKYYFIDHTLFDQFAKSIENESAGGVPELKPEDIKAIAEAIGKINEEYLFTTDNNKAVLVVKSEIGKETVDNRSVYHYKVGYEKERLKVYMNALKEAIKGTKLKDMIKDESFDGIMEQIDQMDVNNEADVWVDLKTKLIRTVRFSDKDNEKSIAEIGLNYEKGDEYPFFLTLNQEQGDFTVKLILNTRTNTVGLNVDGTFKENSKEGKVAADITFEPSLESVQFNKPIDAQSINDLIAPFLGRLNNPNSLNQSMLFDERVNVE